MNEGTNNFAIGYNNLVATGINNFAIGFQSRNYDFGNPNTTDFIFNFNNTRVKLSDVLNRIVDLENQVTELTTELNTVKETYDTELNHIHEKLNHIWYAPGGPGYLEAQKSFENIKNE